MKHQAPSGRVFTRPGLRTPTRQFPEVMKVRLEQVDFGVMKADNEMMVLHSATDDGRTSIELAVNLFHKCVDIEFPIDLPQSASARRRKPTPAIYKVSVSLAQVTNIFRSGGNGRSPSYVIPLDMPPQLFKKSANKQGQNSSDRRAESQQWLRQTGIDAIPNVKNAVTQLHKPDPIVDVGRWLTYRVAISDYTAKSHEFAEMVEALIDYNAKMTVKDINFVSGSLNDLWHGLDKQNLSNEDMGQSLSDLHHMESSVQLSFQTRYQLEVCLSQGVLHECNIGPDFILKLAAVEQADLQLTRRDSMMPVTANISQSSRAARLLETAADLKHRLYDPMDVFKLRVKPRPSRGRMPRNCTMIPSINVTPTTMYLATPVLETSNRVIRQYSHYQDRFLRVRFTDERYRGRIMAADDNRRDEVFDHVARTMTNGVNIGGRHYEFLAFGNSQFREHAAYFFASTVGCTAQDIRNWMGNFNDIRVVAKHTSRIGQCFSTTRAMTIGVTIERIPDIERNGFCFTDGVGQISPFLAQMIAGEMKLPTTDYPSVFQFRLGGCKGVLAVNPDLKGRVVKIRPSQEKFTARYCGLEVCRTSHFSAAYLNMQIILVLSTLGVPDLAFLTMMRDAVSGLEAAMTNERKANEELTKNVDFNQTTLTLAAMVSDGFMESKEPFMMSCLRLWRSWMIKHLKEKAKIFVENGTLVLGCVDETATLQGHSIPNPTPLPGHRIPSLLPEIFLQVPDTNSPGAYKVIEGICILARNPSLHAGDIRVAKAVDIPDLHHLKNCVVLPQTGDRDLGNMCSGGDLDGDDYLVMWANNLIPPQWHHEPMNYEAPPPVVSDGPVTINDLTTFFVSHMKNDNLARIAVAHRYWADSEPHGVKSTACTELAQLHSMAVDYAKTGVPAQMPRYLRPSRWPHWAEIKGRLPRQIYHSDKILGQLYDDVDRIPFVPDYDAPFDSRILEAYDLAPEVLTAAAEVKQQYDEAIRRMMLQRAIESEFEVFTTFALQHNQETGDWKFAEVMGELVASLKEQYQELCFEAAGTSVTERDWSKMGPFIAAMYAVTADEVQAAVKAANETGDGKTFSTMPLMSFPWIFARELGQIATGRGQAMGMPVRRASGVGSVAARKKKVDLFFDVIMMIRSCQRSILSMGLFMVVKS